MTWTLFLYIILEIIYCLMLYKIIKIKNIIDKKEERRNIIKRHRQNLIIMIIIIITMFLLTNLLMILKINNFFMWWLFDLSILTIFIKIIEIVKEDNYY